MGAPTAQQEIIFIQQVILLLMHLTYTGALIYIGTRRRHYIRPGFGMAVIAVANSVWFAAFFYYRIGLDVWAPTSELSSISAWRTLAIQGVLTGYISYFSYSIGRRNG